MQIVVVKIWIEYPKLLYARFCVKVLLHRLAGTEWRVFGSLRSSSPVRDRIVLPIPCSIEVLVVEFCSTVVLTPAAWINLCISRLSESEQCSCVVYVCGEVSRSRTVWHVPVVMFGDVC